MTDKFLTVSTSKPIVLLSRRRFNERQANVPHCADHMMKRKDHNREEQNPAEQL